MARNPRSTGGYGSQPCSFTSGCGQLTGADLVSVIGMTTQFTTGQADQAEFFASLHRAGDPLLLANAWDVASAVAIAAAGAKAIATTSAAVAWSLSVPDRAWLGAERAAAVISRIAAAVSLPVSADIEAGYGDSPDTVAATVAAVVEGGAGGGEPGGRGAGGAPPFPRARQTRPSPPPPPGGGHPPPRPP